jgi:hypothetical protein
MRKFLLVLLVAAPMAADAEPVRVPIIYTTDLYHPHDDPDDHSAIPPLASDGSGNALW